MILLVLSENSVTHLRRSSSSCVDTATFDSSHGIGVLAASRVASLAGTPSALTLTGWLLCTLQRDDVRTQPSHFVSASSCLHFCPWRAHSVQGRVRTMPRSAIRRSLSWRAAVWCEFDHPRRTDRDIGFLPPAFAMLRLVCWVRVRPSTRLEERWQSCDVQQRSLKYFYSLNLGHHDYLLRDVMLAEDGLTNRSRGVGPRNEHVLTTAAETRGREQRCQTP